MVTTLRSPPRPGELNEALLSKAEGVSCLLLAGSTPAPVAEMRASKMMPAHLPAAFPTDCRQRNPCSVARNPLRRCHPGTLPTTGTGTPRGGTMAAPQSRRTCRSRRTSTPTRRRTSRRATSTSRRRRHTSRRPTSRRRRSTMARRQRCRRTAGTLPNLVHSI